ncbi:DUF5712 family protein [Sphingobacterium hotanense]|uniref:DUF5712 family protein n=1 Tax=Sphingobacterium hotanense TaxID=649196 RepID=UPI0021A59662|nr:DUF5712 family protein [Sphingobacterium hotanense]MCT1526836.1 DUF5712 family protein [Sphingobacterium hotanense]
MYINITKSETGDNKGSCSALINYLEKENKDKKSLDQHEKWFNGNSNGIRPHGVRIGIDNNIAKLGKDDSKFFLINISPSQKELAYLTSRYAEQGIKDKLKEFAIKVMDDYAKNFRRDNIRSHKDLLWFGKLENYGYYGYNDKEVKNGTRQRGERKEGQQLHLQIIVSRKDITNRIKLSPQNTSRGKNASHSAKLGQFDRTAFKQSGETLFDDIFDFDRGLKEWMDYANTMKNGTAMQKAQLHAVSTLAEHYPQLQTAHVTDSFMTDINIEKYPDVVGMLSSIAGGAWGLFEILLEPTLDASGCGQTVADEEERKRKRKKKKGLRR